MTETNSEEKMDVESSNAAATKTPKKKKEAEPLKEEPKEEDDDDSEDSVPLKKLAALKKRGKGAPATKVTMGRKRNTPVKSPPSQDHNLDFEDEEEQKVVKTSRAKKATKQVNKKAEAAKAEKNKSKDTHKGKSKETPSNTDAASMSSADEKHDDDDDLAACCLCHCALDYSDRSAFFEADRKQEIENQSSGSDEEPLYFQPTDPYLPTNLFDPLNALVYCDTCDRLYHQKCHFVPVMVLPRGKWSCLVCTTKDSLTTTKATKQSKSTSKSAGRNKKTVERNDALFTKHKVSRMFKSPLPPTKLQQYLTEDGTGHNKGYHTAAEMEWELATGRAKATLWNKTLTQTIPTWIQSQMSNLSQARTALETLTQTKQNRQHFLENNKASKRGSQELAQTLVKLSGAKWKMRQMVLNLEEIRANPERHIQLMQQWCRGPQAVESETAEARALAKPPPKSFTERVIFPFGQYPPRTVPRTPEMEEELGQNKDDQVPSEIVTTNEPRLEDKKSSDKRNKKQNPAAKKKSKTGDDDSSSGVSLDDLVCCVCMSNEASDENDMLLCDAQGCFRAFHMECLDPPMTLKEVEDTEGEDWFCPLCSGMADCVHKIQSYYMGEDWDRRRQERAAAEAKKHKSKGKESPSKGKKKTTESNEENEDDKDMRDSDDDDSLRSWEKPGDVFLESKWEYDTALELRAGKRNEETDTLLREALGEADEEQQGNLLDYISDGTDDVELDAHFDLEAFHEERKRQYEEPDDDDDDDADEDSSHSSQATLVDMSSVELKIGKDELNALSEGSDSDDDDDDGSDDEDNDDGSKGSQSGPEVRRSRRLRKRLSPEEMKRTAGVEFDVSNIVQGKRRRKPVDYRKLNDALFGNLDEKEIAKIDDKEDFHVPIPKKKVASSSGEEDDNDEESSDNENGDEKGGSDDGSTRRRGKREEKKKKTAKASRKRSHSPSDEELGSGNEAENDDSSVESQANGAKEKKKAATKPPAKKKRRASPTAKKATAKKRNGTKTKDTNGTKDSGKKEAQKKTNGAKSSRGRNKASKPKKK